MSEPPRPRATCSGSAAGAAVGVGPEERPRDVLAGLPPAHPRWRFVFVNHALTNPFFVPAKNGSHDAASLLGVDVQWTGSMSSDVAQMVKAMRHAIAAGADGIAVSMIDPTAFNSATRLALSRGIPVVSYNADGGKQNKRLAYIGQDNYQSGLELGARVGQPLLERGRLPLHRHAGPGRTSNRASTELSTRSATPAGRSGPTSSPPGVDVGHERKKIEATYLANRKLRGLFAVDAGSTAGVADVMRKYKLHKRGVRAGGYDLLPVTLRAIHDRHVDFTIDQQPYLQGFLPVLQMFLYRYSGHLVAPADTNTGLNFVTRASVGRYLTTRSRFEGS